MNNLESTTPGSAEQAGRSAKDSKGFFTIDRIIIYLLLLVAIAAVANDRRIFSNVTKINNLVYDAAIENGNKFGGQTTKPSNLDSLSDEDRKKLLEAVTRPSLFQAWMKEQYGVEPDKELSKVGTNYFVFSSGIRTFQIKITYNAPPEVAKYDRGAVGISELTSYYFWQSPEDAI
jgi:hypothetical protein